MRGLWAAVVCVGSWGCIVPDALVDAYLDADGDGERTALVGGTDCDDTDPAVASLAVEVCGNGIDDDCDGLVDDVGEGASTWFRDEDGDGFGDPLQLVEACVRPPSTATVAGDCDDGDRRAHPDAVEDCLDGVDNDCDGLTDEADAPPVVYQDADGDGFGAGPPLSLPSCVVPEGWVTNASDCDDRRADAHPGAPEVWYDGVDQACDGGDDLDRDGDGVRVDPALADPPVTDPTYTPGTFAVLDCDDTRADVHPGAPEVWYDGVDADCSGGSDHDQDADGDPIPPFGGDCDDQDADRSSLVAEVSYDGVDDDCDPTNDDDADGDGHAWAGSPGGTDCDDGHDGVWSRCATCEDADGDGAWVGCDAATAAHPADCDDTDWRASTTCGVCSDGDGDGAWWGCDRYRPDDRIDCNDALDVVWSSCATCEDADGDGAWTGCDRATVERPWDCDDLLANAWSTCDTCEDVDGDGWGAGLCDGAADCAPEDADLWAACASCRDEDGDGSRRGCDAYGVWPYDCDDTDPHVGGHRFEVIGDGVDQDCDGEDLVVEEAHGVFVAPAGVDAPTCGARIFPCRTPGHAADLAAHDGKVLFLAAGTYGALDARVDVYGGFDEVTWARDTVTSPTWLQSGDAPVLRTRGARQVVDGVRVRDAGVGGARTSVWLGATFQRLHDVRVEAPGPAESSVLVRAQGHGLELEDVGVSGGASTLHGVGLQVDGVALVRVDDLRVAITQAGVGRELTAVRVEGSSHEVALRGVVAEAEGGAHPVGLELGAGVDQAMLEEAHFRASTQGVHPAEAARLAASRTTWHGGRAVASSAGSATGVSRLEGDVQLVGVVARGAGSNARALVAAGAEAFQCVNATLLARGVDAVGVELSHGGEWLAVNTVVSSDGGALWGGASELDHVHLDAPCLVGSATACEVDALAEVVMCGWAGCVSAAGVQAGDAALDPVSEDGAAPLPGSPLVDAGRDPTAFTVWLRDVEGQARPVGSGFDLGAVER